MWLCENQLKGKIGHFRLPSLSLKTSALSCLMTIGDISDIFSLLSYVIDIFLVNSQNHNHVTRRPYIVLHLLGTFFGMKPCGIILFVYELFISESKSQVYGILHDVLSKWGLDKIGM